MKREINIEKRIIIFIIAYSIFQVSWIFEEVPFIGQIKPIITRIVLVLLFICGIMNKYTSKREIIIDVIIILISLISMYITKSTIFFVNIMFIIVFKDMSLDKFIKFDIKLRASLVGLLFVTYFLGLTNSEVMYRDNGIARYSLGFQHPNLLGAYVLSICAEYIYLRYKKINFVDYIVLVVVTILLTIITDSRSAQIGMILLLIFTLIGKINNGKLLDMKGIKCGLTYLPIIMTVVSIGLAIWFETKDNFIVGFDKILSTRINCMHDFLYHYGITVLGSELTNLGNFGKWLSTLDNSYLYVLMQNGIIVLLGLIVGLSKVNKDNLKNKNYNVVVILAMYAIYGFVETYFTLVKTNPFLLCLSFLIYENETQTKVLKKWKI